jgi:hypothetical protein
MISQIETVLVLAAVAAACAVPGVFLLLRRMALASDAISHVLLLGIVVAYFAVGDLASPPAACSPSGRSSCCNAPGSSPRMPPSVSSSPPCSPSARCSRRCT